MKVQLINYPDKEVWAEVKRRAFVTIGKDTFTDPSEDWKKKILAARHSPIRYIMFSFYIECPAWVSTHLARHKMAQPYIQSQRNDRQSNYDRNSARQDEPVRMIWDLNAEALITVANKRLCGKASKETREVVSEMCRQVIEVCPEFKGELVPMCGREGKCYEFTPCDRGKEKT